MNPIQSLLQRKNKAILSVYFTAGYPHIHQTQTIIRSLQEKGADMVEIGLPFSDPLADGPVIQQSSEQALREGMNIDVLFTQLEEIRQEIHIPLVLMSYLNPMLQYGMEKVLQKSAEVGVSAFIIPDLPLSEFKKQYKALFDWYKISPVFMVSPDTSEERIREMDRVSDSFLYLLAIQGITGAKGYIGEAEQCFFKRVASYGLKNPLLAGFGIYSRQTFDAACIHTEGAIIGTAFINALENEKPIEESVTKFLESVLPQKNKTT